MKLIAQYYIMFQKSIGNDFTRKHETTLFARDFRNYMSYRRAYVSDDTVGWFFLAFFNFREKRFENRARSLRSIFVTLCPRVIAINTSLLCFTLPSFSISLAQHVFLKPKRITAIYIWLVHNSARRAIIVTSMYIFSPRLSRLRIIKIDTFVL